MNFRTLYFILMSVIRYYIYGDYNCMLILKWLEILRNKYKIMFPIEGENFTPVIDMSNDIRIMNRCGLLEDKKIAIFKGFDRSTCSKMFLRIKKAIENNLSIIILSNNEPKDLRDIMRSFLKKNEFEMINTNEINIENKLNEMKYPNINDKEINKYLPCINNTNEIIKKHTY